MTGQHLGINRHYIRRKIDKEIISLEYVPSTEQSVDMLTKGVSGVTLRWLSSKLGIRSLHALALGGVSADITSSPNLFLNILNIM